MKKNKKRNNNNKPTFFTRVIDFILEIIGSILLFLLETFSDEKNESKGDSNEPKLEKFCPRCVGTGYVDENDIKRLKPGYNWTPGVCGFCKGTGYVDRSDTRNPRLDTMSTN